MSDEAMVNGSISIDEPRDKKPRSSRLGCLVGCVIFLPVFYFLSPLPVVLLLLLLERFGWDSVYEGISAAADVTYWPINRLYAEFEPVQEFYDWYLSLAERFAP